MPDLTNREQAGLVATRSHLTHALGALPRRRDLTDLLLIGERIEAAVSDLGEMLEDAGAGREPDEHPKAMGEPSDRELARGSNPVRSTRKLDDTDGWWSC